MMYDGGAPPESVTIERVCSANSVRAEGYTDSKGRFSFNLGQNNGVFADASTDDFSAIQPVWPGWVQRPTTAVLGRSSGNANPDSAYWDCELRARLPGYRSDTVSLAGRRMLDTPDVGVIVLYPIAKIQGLTASATSIQAPKDARKAYEKGLERREEEQDRIRPSRNSARPCKSTPSTPRPGWSWERCSSAGEHYPEAREAYASALAADSKFVYPYQQLYQMALREQNWKDLVG